MTMTTPESPPSCQERCDVCGGRLVERKLKKHCEICGQLCATCCDGGRE